MFLQALSRNLARRSLPVLARSHVSSIASISCKLIPEKKTPSIYSRKFSSATDDLSAIIERELSEEEGNDTLPPSLIDLKSTIEEDWTIVDSTPGSDSSAYVKMYRKSSVPSGSKVVISFHCQDTMVDEAREDDELLEDETEDEEEEDAVAFRFRTTVTKAGRSMIFGCVSDEGEVKIESLVVREGEEQEEPEGQYSDKLYQGPEFSELAEDLQESITVYLQEECGVDGDFAAFVSMYADYKEQTEYINWLKTLESFTS